MKNEVVVQLRLSRGVIGLLAVTTCIALGVSVTTVLAQSDQSVNGCYEKKGVQKGDLRIVKDPNSCKSTESAISWNQAGPRGEQGPPGPDGGDAGTLDGLDSTDFLPSDGKAADSALLDGKPSSEFLSPQSAVKQGRPAAGGLGNPGGESTAISIDAPADGYVLLIPEVTFDAWNANQRINGWLTERHSPTSTTTIASWHWDAGDVDGKADHTQTYHVLQPVTAGEHEYWLNMGTDTGQATYENAHVTAVYFRSSL